MKKVLRLLLLLDVFLYFAAVFMSNQLPQDKDILARLYNEPLQSETDKPEFKVKRGEITYTIKPLYNYRLYGMVVSSFNTATWWNYYHPRWKDFINIKDICVIWGNNLKNDVYSRMLFSSLSFECHWSCFSQDDCSMFDHYSISNNHLLTDTKKMNETVMQVKKGDQIYLEGYLVQYLHSNGAFYRSTSTTRKDEGAGACETIYVKKITILKKANVLWYWIRSFSKYSVFVIIFFLLVLHTNTPAYGRKV